MKQILYSPLPSIQQMLEPSIDIHDTVINGISRDFQKAIINISVIIANEGTPIDFNERIKQVLVCCADMYDIIERIIKEQEKYYAENA